MQVEKCIEEIRNELELLESLLESHQELVEKARLNEILSRVELSAAATVLHSFYNGIENIFRRIANRIDKACPSSEFWHQELLEQMIKEEAFRPRVISDKLYDTMSMYLGFRHFFRHAYAFQFKWRKMEKLILNIQDSFEQFKEELSVFISEMEK